MITVALLLLCILSSGFTGNIYKKISADSRSVCDSAWMTALWFFPLGALFALLSYFFGSALSPLSFGVALISGLCIFAAASILLESIKVTALSVSLIIINLNFIIPVLCSVIFLSERALPIQIIGVLLSVAVIVLVNFSPQSRGKGFRGAVLLPLIASVSNGLVNFCIKINQSNGGNALSFFAVMYLLAGIIAIFAGLILSKKRRATTTPALRTQIGAVLPFALLMALCNGICFYTTELLAARISATVQFTVVTAASILLSLGFGFLFQGEKFNKKTAVSILFCVIAILCQCAGLG